MQMALRLLSPFILFITSATSAIADVNVLVIGSATDSSSQSYVFADEGVAPVSAFDPADVVSELTSILGGGWARDRECVL